MPASSEKQKRLMDAAAHNPAFAKKVGIPSKVAKEFSKASKGQTFKEGGEMKKLFGGKETRAEEMKEAKALKSGKISPKQFARGEKSEGHKEENSAKIAREIKSGKMSPAKYAKSETSEKYARGGGIEVRGKTKGKMLARGGGIEIKGKTKGKMLARGGKTC